MVTDAERSNGWVTSLLHIISDVTRVRHAQGTALSVLRAFIACATAVQTAVLVLFGPSCLRTIGRCRGVLPRTNARCVADQQNRETKFTATFDQNLPSMKYIFAFLKKNYCKYCLRDNF